MDLTTDNNNDSQFPLADLSTFIFVLSAIHPDKHAETIRNLSTFIKPGGLIFMRDYGAMDHAMCRFSGETIISDRFYVRQDGTRLFFFAILFLFLFIISGRSTSTWRN